MIVFGYFVNSYQNTLKDWINVYVYVSLLQPVRPLKITEEHNLNNIRHTLYEFHAILDQGNPYKR